MRLHSQRRSHSLGLRPARSQPAGPAGFSLPEMMVVLAILMLLVVLAVPNLQQATARAEEAAAVQTMKSVHTAQEAHRITHGSYAPDFQVLVGQGGAPVVPDEADTGGGGSGESLMVYHGYIFRLNRPLPEEYTLTAEPIHRRDSRPYYAMDHVGSITMNEGSLALGGGTPLPDEEKGEEGSASPGPEDENPN